MHCRRNSWHPRLAARPGPASNSDRSPEQEPPLQSGPKQLARRLKTTAPSLDEPWLHRPSTDTSTLLPSLDSRNNSNPRPPHSTVRGGLAEIETIYRAYQVLLLNWLETGLRAPLHSEAQWGRTKKIGATEGEVQAGASGPAPSALPRAAWRISRRRPGRSA